MSYVKRVVIAGGGTSGWLTAAAIAKLYGKRIEVTLVDCMEIGRIGVGEATIPPLRNFHRLLGIEESEFMAATQATFKLGIEFNNWARQGDKYIHSFGVTGKDCWACDFHHFWMAGHNRGLADSFGEYNVERQAAIQHRLLPGDSGKLNYAYHLDAGLYADFLRNHALKYGAHHINGKIESVDVSVSDGSIQALMLNDGSKIDGDLFIDCSGFRAILIGEALNVSYEPYGHFLPCDSAIAIQTESASELAPYTESIAHEFGWQWRIPLQHRFGNGLVYCSRHVSDSLAEECLLQSLQTDPVSEPKKFQYRTGRRTQAWYKNCVAIGLSSGFLEPLESTSIHLAMSAILRLLKFFPRESIVEEAVLSFNRQTQEEMEMIRDFIILHYKATERNDSAFWRYCARMDIPETLEHRLKLFNSNGGLLIANKELFQVDSWAQVMLGQRILPQDHHPIVDLMGDDELDRFLKTYKNFVRDRVGAFPLHKKVIENYCRSCVTEESS